MTARTPVSDSMAKRTPGANEIAGFGVPDLGGMDDIPPQRARIGSHLQVAFALSLGCVYSAEVAIVAARQRLHADVRTVLDQLDVAASRVRAIPENHGMEGNANWHVWSQQGSRSVLRRYYTGTTPADLAYEHAVLEHLTKQGWNVPDPLAPPIEHDGRWYCLTRYVPGRGRPTETPSQQRQRGADLARLHVALRPTGWANVLDGSPCTTTYQS